MLKSLSNLLMIDPAVSIWINCLMKSAFGLELPKLDAHGKKVDGQHTNK
jgi:hypothetical protein